MTSQLDLDQGGTSRQWTKVYLGPSIGWLQIPYLNVFPIVATGTYVLDLSSSYVPVNTATAVTITLPSAANPAAGAGALPGPFADNSIVIVDVGGNAAAHPITIQPQAGQTIMGLASIQLTSNYGSLTLTPNATQLEWNAK